MQGIISNGGDCWLKVARPVCPGWNVYTESETEIFDPCFMLSVSRESSGDSLADSMAALER